MRIYVWFVRKWQQWTDCECLTSLSIAGGKSLRDGVEGMLVD